jgi:hypothetical protein
MFIVRGEGHVAAELLVNKIHMALLTEGADARTSYYKHCPPDGGPAIRRTTAVVCLIQHNNLTDRPDRSVFVCPSKRTPRFSLNLCLRRDEGPWRG